MRMATAEELREEALISQMSKTEKELYFLREDFRRGKIDREVYEEAVDCSLFWAKESGRITEAESDRLYERYVG